MYNMTFLEYIVSFVCHINRECQKIKKNGLFTEQDYYMFDKFNQALLL